MKFSTSAAIFRWKPAAWLRVTGEDAANFLQGQFTNELRKLSPGEAKYGLWLTVKGKVLADSFVLRSKGGVNTGAPGAAEYWVGSYFSPAAVIRERLEAFIIADDVVIEDVTAEWAGVAIFDRRSEVGDRSSGADAGERGGVMDGEPEVGMIFPGRRDRAGAVEWVYPVAEAAAVGAAVAGLPELSEAEVAARRIAAGVPAVPADIGPGDLPGEGALEDEAISYTKGCYLGQEVMARLKSMGQVRRRLLRVASEGEAPATLPTELFIGPRKVGELRSVAPDAAGGWTGLAMLSLLHVSAGATLAFAADGAAVVRLTDTP